MSKSFSISRRQFVQGAVALGVTLPFSTALAGCDGGTSIIPGEGVTTMTPGEEILQNLWQNNFLEETEALVRIRAYRGDDLSEEQVVGNIGQIKQLLEDWADQFNNAELQNLRLEPFEWKKNITPEGEDQEKEYWLFGFRIGPSNPTRKVAMICHLDTVPPGQETADWQPFDPHIEEREYRGGKQNFLVGRGTIDDEGPAISAFIAARALAKQYDGTGKLDDLAVEIFFDTSEETDMATPRYLDDDETRNPDFGIVYDAQWCVRAEKGAERPVFVVNYSAVPPGQLWIESLQTAPSSATNQIPDWAEAQIQGDPLALKEFLDGVEAQYNSHEFDDPDYTRAKLDVSMNDAGDTVILRTLVAGAQHGSAPDENRESGANPLVSLANFLADLVSDGTLEANAIGAMTEFMKWTWGTRVFGENHEKLVASDEVFTVGTTYALTKLTTTEGNPQLAIDIRYATDHHSQGWDGQTEGLLPGEKSVFEGIFQELIAQFNAEHENYLPVELKETKTIFAPDIRVPSNNEDFQKVFAAYEAVMEKDCPQFAVGGGTDAKGYTYLIAAGPLFSDRVGPPINYHGIGEGAPLEDMEKSTQILYNVMVNEIEDYNSESTEKNDGLNANIGRRPKAFKGHKFSF